MPVVRVLPQAENTQVEGFPKGSKETPFKRSGEGALHFRPGSTKVITDDELGFIKERRPELYRCLLVVAKDSSKKAPPEVKPTVENKEEPPGNSEPSKGSNVQSDPIPEGANKGGKGSKGRK